MLCTLFVGSTSLQLRHKPPPSTTSTLMLTDPHSTYHVTYRLMLDSDRSCWDCCRLCSTCTYGASSTGTSRLACNSEPSGTSKSERELTGSSHSGMRQALQSLACRMDWSLPCLALSLVDAYRRQRTSSSWRTQPRRGGGTSRCVGAARCRYRV